jgi:hypothetical protein
MMRFPMVLALVVSTVLARPASAGIVFGRHKANPAERVPQLLATLKTDQDEHKREAAAKELRDFDGIAYPDIVPVLIDALQHDAKVGVRSEAAQSLAHLRPISQAAGRALEEAAANDASMRVRLHAHNLLLHYRLSGYRSKGKNDEPPLAPPAANVSRAPAIVPVPQTASNHSVSGRRNNSTFVPAETPPPPLAPPLLENPSTLPPPRISTQAPLVPSRVPTLQAPPSSRDNQGPVLMPPQ